MTRPACFGTYTPSPDAECRGCALRPMCARRVDVDGFGILPHARIPSADVSEPLATFSTPAAKTVLWGAAKAGFRVTNSNIYTTASSRAFVTVSESVAQVVLFIPAVPAHRLHEFPDATGADIRAWKRRDGLTLGSIAIFADPGAALRLIIDLAKDLTRA